MTTWNEQVKLEADFLACSWYLYRTKSDNTLRSVNKSVLKKEDYDYGKKIREHFSGKLILLQLSGKHITPYRLELLRVLSQEDHTSFMQEHAGMLMTLPRLYTEDMFLEGLREKYDNTPWRMTEVHNETVERTLTFIGNHAKSFSYGVRVTSRDTFMCNWFHDENDRLYLIETEDESPYRFFFKTLIKKPFRIVGNPVKRHNRDDLRYYTLHDYYFVPNAN